MLEEKLNVRTIQGRGKENYKTTTMEVTTLNKKIESREICLPTEQRSSGQWNSKQKSNLILTITFGEHIPEIILGEQKIGKTKSRKMLLDGLQRCSTVKAFCENKFPISKKVDVDIIQYEAVIYDETGKAAIDEDGVVVTETKDFYVKNKYFQQFPKELQEYILNYCFTVTILFDCTDESIPYHLARYNSGKVMNANEKGIIALGHTFAPMVRNITNSDFFVEHGLFKPTDIVKDNLSRIVINSVMMNNFLNKWKSTPNVNAEYIRKYGSIEMFDDIEVSIEALNSIAGPQNDALFTVLDTPFWVVAFTHFRFNNPNIYEEEFGKLLDDFPEMCKEFKVNERTWDDIKNSGSTTNIGIVTEKLNYLDEFVKMYFSSKNEIVSD